MPNPFADLVKALPRFLRVLPEDVCVAIRATAPVGEPPLPALPPKAGRP